MFIPKIAHAACDRRLTVRNHALGALFCLYIRMSFPKKCAAGLVDALMATKKIPGFMYRAAANLGGAAIPRLIKYIYEDHPKRTPRAGFALVTMGKVAVPALRQCLKSRNPRVVKAARFALDAIKKDMYELKKSGKGHNARVRLWRRRMR